MTSSSDTSNTPIVEYAKSTQNVCMCLAISIFLIILFMMTPLNSFILSSIFGKIIIITLLGYTLYYNINQTNKVSNKFNISLMSGNWNELKTNIICSYIFSVFLLVLLLSVVRNISF
jgi:hypothetical protein